MDNFVPIEGWQNNFGSASEAGASPSHASRALPSCGEISKLGQDAAIESNRHGLPRTTNRDMNPPGHTRASIVDLGSFGEDTTILAGNIEQASSVHLLNSPPSTLLKSNFSSQSERRFSPCVDQIPRLPTQSNLPYASAAYFRSSPFGGGNTDSFFIRDSQENVTTNYGTSYNHALELEGDVREAVSACKPLQQYSRVTEEDGNDDENSESSEESLTFTQRIMDMVDDWLSSGVEFDNEGVPKFRDSLKLTLPSIVRTLFFNPLYPEFTSLQQFS